MKLNLFVWNQDATSKIPAVVKDATQEDFKNTKNWQTKWTSKAAKEMPNKVALRCRDSDELLGLMSYELDEKGLAVEVIYLESAAHSNANLLHESGAKKKYIGIAKALFSYAVAVSMEAGFDGVVYFKAKTTRLRSYYMQEFGAMPLGSYDPFRLVIWEDAAQALICEYQG
jgi:hypothetical protein